VPLIRRDATDCEPIETKSQRAVLVSKVRRKTQRSTVVIGR
jgi:hypothetical protein